MNTLQMAHNEPISFIAGAGGALPVREYVDGKASGEQATNEKGQKLWQFLHSRLELWGQVLDDVTVVTPSPVKPEIESSLNSVSTLYPPISISVRARANNGWGDLVVKASGKLKQGDK